MSFIFESCKEAIRVTFIGFTFIAIGFLIQNESFNVFYTFKSTFSLFAGECCLRFGECIIVNLPIIFMLNLVCKKTSSAFPLISALLGYFAFLIGTMIFSPTGLDSCLYISSNFVSSVFTGLSDATMKLPLNTGMIGSFIVAFLTRYTYIRSRHNNIVYSNSYFDKDLFGIFFNIVLCFAAGIFISASFPFLYEQLKKLFVYIGYGLNDPTRVGIFGILDRVFSIIGLPNIVKDPFYFGSNGGSASLLSGELIYGDVNIWKNLSSLNASFQGAGRFITPYYVINIFIIPSIYVGLYLSITNQKEKARFLLVFILISVLSIICGNPLPTELFLFFSSPILLCVYLVIVGFLFSIMTYFEVFLGSNISSMNAWITMPGNFPDFAINMRNASLAHSIVGIMVIGLIFAVIVFFVVFAYYRYFAIDSSTLTLKNGFINEIYYAIGGKDNIKTCSSGLFRIMVELYDAGKIDIEKIKKLNASRAFVTKTGVNIEVGASAYILSNIINDVIKNKHFR